MALIIKLGSYFFKREKCNKTMGIIILSLNYFPAKKQFNKLHDSFE